MIGESLKTLGIAVASLPPDLQCVGHFSAPTLAQRFGRSREVHGAANVAMSQEVIPG